MSSVMQLDLFADGRDVVLRNAAISALLARDEAVARRSLAALAGERPDDALLPSLACLLEAMSKPQPLLRTHELAAAAIDELDGSITPMAVKALPRLAVHDWLVPLWRALAQAMADLPYRAAEKPVHAAVAWLRAGDWRETEAAVSTIPSWRRIPAPLAWMAQARFAQGNLAPAWPLLAELAWLAPQRFDELARSLDSPVLTRLLRAFDGVMEVDSPGDLAWFPAFVLLAEPVHAEALRESRMSRGSAPERTMRLVLQLLDLERQGRHAEIVASRKKLRDLHSALFERYLQTRR